MALNPLSIMNNYKKTHDEWERYRFYVLPDNRAFTQETPISTDPQSPNIIAKLIIHSDPDDVVWLTATACWHAVIDGHPSILFTIRRDDPVTGKIVASGLENAETFFDEFVVSSFSGVDTGFTEEKEYQYFLTAQNTALGTTGVLIGPVTFNATEIDYD